MKRLIALASLLTITACTDGDRAGRILRQAGYSEVELTGYRMFGR